MGQPILLSLFLLPTLESILLMPLGLQHPRNILSNAPSRLLRRNLSHNSRKYKPTNPLKGASRHFAEREFTTTSSRNSFFAHGARVQLAKRTYRLYQTRDCQSYLVRYRSAPGQKVPTIYKREVVEISGRLGTIQLS